MKQIRQLRLYLKVKEHPRQLEYDLITENPWLVVEFYAYKTVLCGDVERC